jgi:hypothetical protein
MSSSAVCDIKGTDHDAFASERHAGLDVALHRFEFAVAVNEIAGARTNQHVDRNANTLARQCDLRIRGRQSADFQRGTQLDAVSTTFLRGQGGRQRVGGYFEYRGFAFHRQFRLPLNTRPFIARADEP